MAPGFIIEEAHLVAIEHLQLVAEGEIDRLMLFMSPRAGKSQLASVHFPAWYIGNFPGDHIMSIAYKSHLTKKWGNEVKSALNRERYQSVFPPIRISKHKQAAENWLTNFGGQYFGSSIESGIAGEGFHLGIIDDPLSEQEAFSTVAKARVWDWYGPGFYTRQMPERSAIVIMQTRWGLDDLSGRLLDGQSHSEYADKWVVVNIPAILDKARATLLSKYIDHPLAAEPKQAPYKVGDSFAPRRFPKQKLLRIKGQPSLTVQKWNALYLQNPTAEEGAILKRSDWRAWKGEEPPECEFVLQVWDTAFEEGEEADFSACTTWGVFEWSDTGDPNDMLYHCILLDRFNERLGFPELRAKAKEHYDFHNPDRVLIEKKASGHSLIQELRKKRVPVAPFKPERFMPQGRKRREPKSKVGRANVASVVLEEGCVWFMKRDWADEVIDQCAQFPFGVNDDMVDSAVMAWLYLRRMFWLEFGDETDDDELPPKNRRLYGGRK